MLKLSAILAAVLVTSAVASTDLATSVHTADYELYQAENADYRDWKFSELASRLGATKESLTPYLCDGKTEYELLPKLFTENPKGDSLHVVTKDGKTSLLYSGGKFTLNGDVVEEMPDDFTRAVEKAMAELEGTPSGSILISRLEHSPYPLTIQLGGPRFSPANDAGLTNRGLEMATSLQYFTTLRRADYDYFQFTHVGAGGYILFPPDFEAEFIEDDGEKRLAPPTTVIAHEMYHAFDGIRGLLDRRNVWGAGYESIEMTEFRAVRFENQIRKETGLRYRKYYSDDSGQGGVLDSKNQPIVMPSICLSNIPI